MTAFFYLKKSLTIPLHRSMLNELLGKGPETAGILKFES